MDWFSFLFFLCFPSCFFWVCSMFFMHRVAFHLYNILTYQKKKEPIGTYQQYNFQGTCKCTCKPTRKIKIGSDKQDCHGDTTNLWNKSKNTGHKEEVVGFCGLRIWSQGSRSLFCLNSFLYTFSQDKHKHTRSGICET